jgi:CelD/BcsL family acetyltransferase involved in cellulose biosynthesis
MTGLVLNDELDFGGMLTVLRIGGQVAALHLGLRSRTIWHYWTTAYEVAFARYSPGLVMLIQMMKSAEALGLKAIDLGKEDMLYKRRLMSYAVPLAEGTVLLKPDDES